MTIQEVTSHKEE